MILSLAMMLQYSFDLPEAAQRIERAIASVLAEGYRTEDIRQEGARVISTQEMGDQIVRHLR
jgi:3-isopropylmalate dehydrogenase